MLTTLPTLKLRLSLDPADTSHDTILLNALAALTCRFDAECNRTLARTVNASHEFDADQTEILVPCYPIESVTKFETKMSESSGWLPQAGVEYLVRNCCIVSLSTPLTQQSSIPSLARITYTGGYVLPGDPDPLPSAPGSPPVRLPAVLEQAAVEQVAFWYQTRDKLGLKTSWPGGGKLRTIRHVRSPPLRCLGSQAIRPMDAMNPTPTGLLNCQLK